MVSVHGLLKWSSSLSWKEWLKSHQFTYCYEFLWLLAILFKSSKESSEKNYFTECMPDLQKLVRPAISNWLLNSLLPSSTRFLSFWIFPGCLPGTKSEQGNQISWGWMPIGGVSFSKPAPILPMIPGGNNASAIHNQGIQVPQSPKHTPSLIFLVLQRWCNLKKNLLLWLMWANFEASQYLHLFLILGDWKDSLLQPRLSYFSHL